MIPRVMDHLDPVHLGRDPGDRPSAAGRGAVWPVLLLLILAVGCGGTPPPRETRAATSYEDLAARAEAALDEGRVAEAVRLRRTALERARGEGLRTARHVDAQAELARTLRETGDLEGARIHYALALSAVRTVHDYPAADLASLYGDAGDAHLLSGQTARAIDLYQQAYETCSASSGCPVELAAELGTALGTRLVGAGRGAEAVAVLRDVVGRLGDASEAPAETRVVAMDLLGLALLHRGAAAEAVEILERSIALADAELPPEHTEPAEARYVLARARAQQGDLVAAESLLTEAVAIWRASGEEMDERIGDALAARVRQVHLPRGELEAAEDTARETLALRTERFGRDDARTGEAIHLLGQVLEAQGRLDEAEREYEQALRIYEASPAVDPVRLGALLRDLGEVALAREEVGAARDYFERGLAATRREMVADPALRQSIQDGLQRVEGLEAEEEEG